MIFRDCGRPALVFSLLLLPGILSGQTPADPSETIRMLVERIQQLEKRVSELEGSKRPVVPPPPVAAGVVPAEPSAIAAGAEPSISIAAQEQTFPRLRIAGFSDVNFSANTLKGSNSGFNEGQFVLHLSSQLSPKLSFFSELSLTATPPGPDAADSHGHFTTEVERSFIRYEYNDFWKTSFGRYHTPVNYWNTAFHHGTWLQTTVSKPEMTRSFIPLHFVGALTEGVVSTGGMNLNYAAGIGNGRGSMLQNAGDFGDLNNHKAWLLNVFAKPDKLYALQVGASLYRDEIPTNDRPVREWMQGFHLVWKKENPEIIAEFMNAQHRTVGTTTTASSQSWYVQTAYRFPESRWKPYFRFEHQHVPKSDFIFKTVPSVAGSVAGLRWDISSFAAFKFEYRNFRQPTVGRIQYGFVQTSFTF